MVMTPLSVLHRHLYQRKKTQIKYNLCTEFLLTYLACLSRHSARVLMRKTTPDISTPRIPFYSSEPFPKTVQVTAASQKRGPTTFPTTQNLHHIDPHGLVWPPWEYDSWIYFSYMGSCATAPWNLGVLIHIKNGKLKKQTKSISNTAISFG